VLWEGGAANGTGHPTHRVSLKKARHPLLNPATVVPIDIELGDSFRVLLITGPNTGGKTVALKTVGLLSLMAQFGLYVPASEGSIVSVFPAVFVDIGDEQSIAQSLSTFSSHMRTVIAMLRQVTPDSLVLLDELGAGTDPQEGSALARAIIASLLEAGPLVIATTHYSEVKAFAYATPGVENASVEFDVATLAPTYRLTIGVPGRSNALAIARRLGMPPAIIDQASTFVDPEEVRADALLEDIRKKQLEAEAAGQRAAETEAEISQLRRMISKELREAVAARQHAREEALAEAEAELAEIRNLLRRLQRDRDSVAVTREHVEQRRLEVEQAGESVREFKRTRTPKPAAHDDARQIKVGDRVSVVSLGQEGEVVDLDGDEAEVQLGTLKLRHSISGLKRLGRTKATDTERQVFRPSRPEFVPVELDIRGNRAAEVEGLLERYLDEAYRFGLPTVRIIHGKGTGALRQVVRDYLNASPIVSHHELAPAAEGGDGATIAQMREH
jgi:DNA mismatch repair protein MutS2